jgi:3-dehydroquinate synthase
MDRLMRRDLDALGHAVQRSCENKARIVGRDEREAGQRVLLNLGHTFGHAIETATGYGRWLHGEAVAAGMVLAARFSERLGYLRRSDVERVEALLARARLPIEPPALGADRYLELMGHDKKVQAGNIRLVLLKRLGEALLVDSYPNGELRDLLASARSHA